ncbi:hypothetical protein D3Z51_06275 [Clostridiaceae bacterium]|nr:hypothetical protein [Clostridiaceae bacterium]RKI17356.1 hypothetical protein D7V81_02340 [bacterium 1XD21-70]
MAVKYHLNQSELKYLITLGGERSIQEGQEGNPSEEGNMAEAEQIAASRKSLIEKGYIREGEDQKIQVLTPLVSLIRSMFAYEAIFFTTGIQKDGKKEAFCFFFHGGNISFVEQQEGEYSLFEVPSLSLAVGMLANRVEIKNEVSENTIQVSLEGSLQETGLGIERDQIEKQWILMGSSRKDKEEQCMFVIVESTDMQSMLEAGKEEITISKPGRINFINTCLGWMRKVGK